MKKLWEMKKEERENEKRKNAFIEYLKSKNYKDIITYPNDVKLLASHLKKAGYRLEKDRAKNISSGHLGGYQIVDISGNYIVAGANYGLELEDVVEFVKELEASDNR